MGRAEAATSQLLGYESEPVSATHVVDTRLLLRQLTLLALPILAENVLHMFVGLTDVWVAGHLRTDAAAATASVGSISYILWFVGLIVATIGTGSTAVIARAVGARHKGLANSVCGQTTSLALVMGLVLSVITFLGAKPIADMTGLTGKSHDFALFYLRALSISLPFSTFLFAANACLRGAGDTVTPAISMVLVDCTNAVLSFGLARGALGMPELGYKGIAIGTVSAYVLGGVLQFIVLLSGKGKVRLHTHRLRPHWHTMRRILRIGLPAGVTNILYWLAQFSIVVIINRLDRTNVAGSAHIVTVRLESISFMGGIAVATAAATMVGQSLGQKNPARASRSAYLAYLLAVCWMGTAALGFLFLPKTLAGLLTTDPAVINLCSRCIFLAGFVQLGFAASMVFDGALRGAGDTMSTMVINLSSVLLLRLVGVLVAVYWFRLGLVAIWGVLCAELLLRGVMLYLRFLGGAWKRVQV
jgi:putative MATE family efflux protein